MLLTRTRVVLLTVGTRYLDCRLLISSTLLLVAGLVTATFAASLITSPAIGAHLARLYSENFVIALGTLCALSPDTRTGRVATPAVTSLLATRLHFRRASDGYGYVNRILIFSCVTEQMTFHDDVCV